MTSAIILAGGRTTPNILTHLKIIYHKMVNRETYLWDRYKPLVETTVRGVTKPNVAHVLDAITQANSIDDIVIVGEEKLLRESGIDFTGVTLKQQGSSLSENAFIGYQHSQAAKTNEHALFVASDIPHVRASGYEHFLGKCSDDYDLQFCLVETTDNEKRKTLKLRDRGKRGSPLTQYRAGNVIYARIPQEWTAENLRSVDLAYNLRKMRDPLNMLKFMGTFTKDARKYLAGEYHLDELEESASKLTRLSVKIVPTHNIRFEQDIDAVEDIVQPLAYQAPN